MNNGKDFSLLVKDFYKKGGKDLGLHLLLPRRGFNRQIFANFPYKTDPCIWIMGKSTLEGYRSFPLARKKRYLNRHFRSDLACVILSDDLDFPPEFKELSIKKKISLFTTSLSQKDCKTKVKALLAGILPNNVIISGGLLKIFGLGVLIVGDSGVGKSESALELISRGHRFLSDDVTHFEKDDKGSLYGKAPASSRNFMEIRGLGLINIKEIFGSNSIHDRTKINLVINLKKWKEGVEYDRLGLKFPKAYEILGIKVPQLILPVGPGRNISTLIEVACKVHILRIKGYHAPIEMITKLDRVLQIQFKEGEKESER